MITPKDKEKMWKLYQRGESVREIADRFGIYPQRVYRLTVIRKKYGSLYEYYEVLARRKGWTGESEKYLASRVGIKNPEEYRRWKQKKQREKQKYKEKVLGILGEVRDILKDSGRSQEWLAGEAGISRAGLYLYYSGECTPPETRLRRMCEVAGLEAEVEV